MNITKARFDRFNMQPTLFIAGSVLYYLTIVVSTLGVLSNTLAFAVFMRKEMRKFSFSFYFKIMAISDIIALIMPFRHWAEFVFKYQQIENQSPFVYKMYQFSYHVASSISMWTLSLIAFDRMLTIVFPRKFPLLKKRSIQIVLVSIVCIVCLALYVYQPIVIKYLVISDNFKVCSLPHLSRSIIDKIFLWSNLIPILFLNNILTASMIVSIFKSRPNLLTNVVGTRTATRDRKFAITSISLNLICVFCKSPYFVYRYLSLYNSYLASYEFDVLLLPLVVLLFTIDNASSFFVNIMFNKTFSNEFLFMMKLKRRTS